MEQRLRGACKWFDPKKGYGFIAGEDGEDYFVHHSQIQMDGFRTLSDGEEVSFLVGEENGRTMAMDVRKSIG